MRLFPHVGLVLLFPHFGCGGGGDAGAPVTKTSYDATRVAQGLLDEYDTNKDGAIAGAELDACPSLKAALARFDTDKDKKVTKEELEARFKNYSQAAFGSLGINCRVTMAGNVMPGVEVVFTPEKCFADALKGGKGTTNNEGQTSITREDGVPGLAPGLYRVTISGPGVPAEYSQKNLLGHELGMGGRGEESPEFKLQAKPK